jgi:hypothetical protein
VVELIPKPLILIKIKKMVDAGVGRCYGLSFKGTETFG